jgi:uncharacterized protein (DUF305 family)
MSCKILSKNTITDKEFLELMIKHHNVAIKMSQLIQMNSSDDYILSYARRIIYNQTMEVNLMEKLLKSIPNVQNEKSCNCGNSLISTKVEELYPGIFTNAKCDNSYFENFGNTPIQMTIDSIYELLPGKQIEGFTDVKLHENQKITDKEYVDHMVAHRRSGVELAKIILKSTKEPKILALAQNIVLDQEKEMFELVHLHNCIKYSWRRTNYN